MGEGKRERKGERERQRTHAGEKERESWLLLLYVFFHLGLPYANWAQPGVLFVLPEVFTLVLGPSFDLPCLLATAILDSFSLFYLPNNFIWLGSNLYMILTFLNLLTLALQPSIWSNWVNVPFAEEKNMYSACWVASSRNIDQVKWLIVLFSSSISFVCVSCSVMSNSLQPHGLLPIRLLCEILQARILEWVAIPFSRESS